jgi:hypothetical protein
VINRKDFGITGGVAGTLLGDKIMISIQIKAALQD